MAVSFSRLPEKIPVLSKALIWVGYRTVWEFILKKLHAKKETASAGHETR